MKVGVFGNCQSSGMADSIRVLAPDVEVFYFGVPRALKSTPEQISEAMAQFAQCDAVFTQPSVKHKVQGLQPADFEKACKRVVGYPLIASRVAHPDCHYLLDEQGKQVVTPLGPYHSAIAAGAYLEGLSAERALALFNAFTYCALGYTKLRYDDEVVAWEARKYEYDFGDFFAEKGHAFMHTINHPRIEIIFETARQGLAKLGVSCENDIAAPTDNLARNTVWPIYPGLHGKPTRPQVFSFTHEARNLAFSLPEFLAASYEAYASASTLKSPQADKVRSYIREFVVA